MKRRNRKMLGAAIAFGAASVAGAITAYKIKRMSEDDIIENFDEYYDGNCQCKKGNEESGFTIKNVISNIKKCCSKEEVKENSFNNTMKLRRNRVYKKSLKGIKGQKSIY